MFAQIDVWLMLIAITHFNVANTASASSTNMEQQHQKRSSAASFGRFGVDPNYFLTNHPYYDDDVNNDVSFHKKRQLTKKWAKFFQQSHSPYTIAFPALIRTRRWIEQEQ